MAGILSKYKKIIALLIIFLMVSVHVLTPVSVLAQVVTPTDTPTPTADQTVTPTDTSTPTPTDTSTPTPTDTPTPSTSDTPSATPTPTTDITTNSNGTVGNNVNSTADSGNNTATVSAGLDPNATPSATPSPDGSGNSGGSSSSTSGTSNGSGSNTASTTVNTGDATAVTTGENNANTTSIDSQVLNQTINIFVDQTGDIDLATPFNIAYTVISQDKNNNPVVNVHATSATSYTYLANDILSTANTGQNGVSTGGSTLVKTGDAYSIVSLVNKANVTVVGSVIHVVTINIFGNFTGNIILPDPPASSTCSTCGSTVNENNKATVANNVDSQAVTGQNNTTTTGSSTIATGDAHSVVNVFNLVNTDMNGVSFEELLIRIFGTWNGNFLGWGDFGPSSGGGNLSLLGINTNGTGGGGCGCTNDLTVNSNASVTNNITSQAITGQNNVQAKSSTINTGNAYSAISLINIINSTFYKSFGFFGFINVFGNWTGNIGGASKFAKTADTQQTDAQDQILPGDNTPESGGALMVTNTNNVGAYVNPNDTVTFFVNATNIGTGKVYGAKLKLALYKDGQFMGGPVFDLRDIAAGKTLHLTTGLVLSKNAPSGKYTAHAYVEGTTGTSTNVFASADSYFMVSGANNGSVLAASVSGPTNNHTGKKTVKIAGAYTNKNKGSDDSWPIFLLTFFMGTFLAIRITKRRTLVKGIFVKALPFYTRLQLLRSFLL